mgnify:CR=1 FL=1
MMEVDDTLATCKEKREMNAYSRLKNEDEKFKEIVRIIKNARLLNR